MFLNNLEKCLKVFDRVYVTSDSKEILELAQSEGAYAIRRGPELCGDVPDIPVFQHAMDNIPNCDGFVAVHADTPMIEQNLIVLAKRLLEMGVEEIMTCHKMNGGVRNYKDQANRIYGSIRAMSRFRAYNYPNAMKPDPDVLLVDTSPEIETLADYQSLFKQYGG